MSTKLVSLHEIYKYNIQFVYPNTFINRDIRSLYGLFLGTSCANDLVIMDLKVTNAFWSNFVHFNLVFKITN